MHKLIIGSINSTTLHITPHKLLPVHPSGHILCVHIFDVGEINYKASCYQQLAKLIICMYNT